MTGSMLAGWPGVKLKGLPGRVLMRAVDAVDRASAGESECLGAVAAAKRLQRQLDARMVRFLERATRLASLPATPGGPREAIDAVELVAAEIGLALSLSRGEAENYVATAVAVCRELPLILALVERGDLDWRAAVSVHTQMIDRLHPGSPLWDQVQRALAAILAGKSVRNAISAAKREILKADPESARRNHQLAFEKRCVVAYPLADGMGGVTATLRADQAQLIQSVLDALADACRDYKARTGVPDLRTHDQRCADALVAIFRAIHENRPMPLIPANPPPDDTTFTGRIVPAGHPAAPATPSAPSAPSAPVPAAPEDDVVSAGPADPAVPRESTGTQAPKDPETPARPADPASTESPDRPSSRAESKGPAGSASPTGLADPAGPANPVSPAGPADPVPSPADDGQVVAWWLPPRLPTWQGRRPHLVITMSATTLLGLDDLPGELSRHGAVPADLAREIARQAEKVTVISDTGRSHPPGDQAHCAEPSTRYKPRQSVVDQVLGRFQRCVHPSCTRDAVQCDIDHAIPYAKGGKSCPCNLIPLCRFHHRLKTHAGWTLRLTRPDEPYPAGTIIWNSRLGQIHVERPHVVPGSDDLASHTAADRQEEWDRELQRVDPVRRRAASSTRTASSFTRAAPTSTRAASTSASTSASSPAPTPDFGEPPF